MSSPGDFGAPIRLGTIEVRPVRTPAELAEVLELRALAFRGDGGLSDRDAFDDDALHLRAGPPDAPPQAALRLLLHPQGRIRGYAARFYDLARLEAQPGAALELGRLCLHPARSDPDLMRALWAGVARVVDAAGAARLIGCTSFPGTDPARLAPALGLLALRHQGPPELAPGVRAPRTQKLAPYAPQATAAGAALLPPLLRSYLALGGWVSDHLVIDADLGTCHVFTCVDIAGMPEGRKRILRALAGQGG